MKIWIALIALLAPVAAQAADNVSLASEVLVERVKPDAQGKPQVVQEKPNVVVPGDKLVFVLNYRNGGAEPATGFTVTNPIPAAVSFAGGEDSQAVVSIDGGRSWGKLASLKVAQPDGTSRSAVPADVTHIRWSFSQPIAASSGGKLSFRGVVK
ncbi:MAG: hypothetical protein QOG72_1613 [Sphingomonadales bacterium]|jgi:uncharacterized repeat protein (TIGR01451 family)|nr:hypothetical protein [Sphingomonadales bacterium]